MTLKNIKFRGYKKYSLILLTGIISGLWCKASAYNTSSPVDSIQHRIKAQLVLEKAKANKDWVAVSQAYRTIMFNSPKKEWLGYADSIIANALLTNNNKIIGEAYLTKGIIYFEQKEHNKALDNYIKADQYLCKTNEEYTIHKARYALAQTKYYLGFYDEAIALFRQSLPYFEEENDAATLNTYHALGLCYNKIKKFDLCSYFNKKGLKLAKESQNEDMITYFKHSEAINQYSLKKYEQAVKELKKVIPMLKQKKDYANESVACFYIGKSFWDLNQKDSAISYFKKVDVIFTNHHYIRPDLRETYQYLLNNAKTANNSNLRLYYINRLFKIDSILNTNYKYLSKKIHKEYDTQKLLQEKEALEENLRNNSVKNNYLIIGLLITMTTLCIFHFRTKKRIKKKFEEALNKSNENKKVKTISKIDHIVELLKSENKFRNYTNKALAEEAGFNSTQNFTNMFKKRLGISPTNFIEELKKQYPL